MELTLLNGGSAYGPYDVNRIPLTSDLMPAALLSDPMIRLTPIFDIGAVFRIQSIHRRGLKPPSASRYTAVTVMLLVVYIHVPLYAIHHFAPLFHSTTTSNNSPPKVRVDSPVVVVEYTTAYSTGYEPGLRPLL